jgi:hypothetical protein
MKKKGDYVVGYGKPPVEHRFKKGLSGNPKGRRKGSKNFGTDVLETLKTPVPINDAGKRSNVSTQKAMLLRLREKALKGDQRALDRLLELARAYNDEDLGVEANSGLPESDQLIISRALARFGGARDRDRERDGAMDSVADGSARVSAEGGSAPVKVAAKGTDGDGGYE